jgi:exodeoxyribonuclease-5
MIAARSRPFAAISPLFLRDGRIMYRFCAAEIPAQPSPDIAPLLDKVRRGGARLVPDGSELRIVERCKGQLHPAVLRRLSDNAGDIIAALRSEHRRRVAALPPECCAEYDPTTEQALGDRRMVYLTDEQRAAATAIADAIERREHFALFGLAGTGKTTLAAHIAWSRPGAYLCAPTGKAASVLARKTGQDATTVHRKFYTLVETIDRESQSRRLVFQPRHAPGSLKGKVMLLDECSMINKQVAANIISTGVTVIAIGDPGQLPPVENTPFFTQASFTLREVHRQALQSPIIRQAHAVRAGGDYEPDGDAFRVVDRLTAGELRSADMVLVWRRATRSRMNALRRRALGISAPLPLRGEPLVCLRNTPKHGLYNGAIYRASRDLLPGDRTVGISVDECEVEVEADFLPLGHEDDQPDRVQRGRKTSFAFGYAMTTHKAQGSEFDRVLLIDENHGPDRIAWLYTAITRAIEHIVVVSCIS